mgnify:CR=1 FL=1
MRIEELTKRIQEFDKKLGWDKTQLSQIIEFMQKELDTLKLNSENKERVDHLLTDLLVLIIQAGYKNKTNFNSEIEKWFREEKKNLK